MFISPYTRQNTAGLKVTGYENKTIIYVHSLHYHTNALALTGPRERFSLRENHKADEFLFACLLVCAEIMKEY